MNNYSTIANFGCSAGNTPQNNPLTYCLLSGLESGFNHTLGSGSSLLGPNSSQCQVYMAEYCAANFDGACEYASNDRSTVFPNIMIGCGNNYNVGPCVDFVPNKGQSLIRNTAAEKYLVAMSGNCVKVYEPFDPTVAFSPMIGKWVPNGNTCDGQNNCDYSLCIPVYDVDAKKIDSDVVMNKILVQPCIAIDILVNIYNTRNRTGKLNELKGTKLGNFFNTVYFKNILDELRNK